MFLFPLQFKNSLNIIGLEDKLAQGIVVAIWNSASLVLKLPRPKMTKGWTGNTLVCSVHIEGRVPF